MKAKELLGAKYTLRKGKDYLPIVKKVQEGTINPRATYIQTFDKYEFCTATIVPDVVFTTNALQTCYLYKVD